MMHKNWIFRNDLFVSHPLGLLAHRVICCEWKKRAERSLTNWAVALCHICLPCCKICDRCDVSSPVHCTTTLSKEKKSLILDITVSCIWLIQIFSLFSAGKGVRGSNVNLSTRFLWSWLRLVSETRSDYICVCEQVWIASCNCKYLRNRNNEGFTQNIILIPIDASFYKMQIRLLLFCNPVTSFCDGMPMCVYHFIVHVLIAKNKFF